MIFRSSKRYLMLRRIWNCYAKLSWTRAIPWRWHTLVLKHGHIVVMLNCAGMVHKPGKFETQINHKTINVSFSFKYPIFKIILWDCIVHNLQLCKLSDECPFIYVQSWILTIYGSLFTKYFCNKNKGLCLHCEFHLWIRFKTFAVV